jgi:hypothetical protein
MILSPIYKIKLELTVEGICMLYKNQKYINTTHNIKFNNHYISSNFHFDSSIWFLDTWNYVSDLDNNISWKFDHNYTKALEISDKCQSEHLLHRLNQVLNSFLGTEYKLTILKTDNYDKHTMFQQKKLMIVNMFIIPDNQILSCDFCGVKLQPGECFIDILCQKHCCLFCYKDMYEEEIEKEIKKISADRLNTIYSERLVRKLL